MCICIHVYVNGFDKSRLPQTQWQTEFLPPLDFYINELTMHVCIIANGSLVCFSQSLFLGPVWHVWVLGWFSNGSGVTGKAPTWLEIATQLGRKLSHQIGYYLWWLEFEWVSGETFWQCQLQHVEKPTFSMAPHHLQPPPLYDHLWGWHKNYLKWQAIQLAVFCRVGQLKDIV